MNNSPVAAAEYDFFFFQFYAAPSFTFYYTAPLERFFFKAFLDAEFGLHPIARLMRFLKLHQVLRWATFGFLLQIVWDPGCYKVNLTLTNPDQSRVPKT